MSKLIERLRTIDIFNPYNMATDGMPIVQYVGGNNGRGGHSAYWSVFFKGRKLKDAAWYENGGKHFVMFGTTRDEELQKALAFVKTLRPNVEMVKAPFYMTYVSKTDLELAMKRLKEKKEG